MANQVIVVSGSLRKASFTTALCRAVCALPASDRTGSGGEEIGRAHV